jgi:hypothetical protein
LTRALRTTSKHAELLLDLTGTDFVSRFLDIDDVEPHSLCKSAALANGKNISFLYTESWGAVSCDILVAFFESSELRNEMQVITTDDDGSAHPGRQAHTLQDAATDRHTAGEWAFCEETLPRNG